MITATLLGGAIVGSLLGAGAANAETAGQENAIEKAESYLEVLRVSRQGLIEQLEYEQFSAADATFAVDHVTVDWNKEAVEKAESYLKYSSFSTSRLIDQLEYEGFTVAQAQYGANTAYEG